MKKIIAVLVSMIFIVALTGCGYSSSYKATGFVHTNHAQDASMSFHTFDGRMVFKLKGTGEGEITYSGKLDSGNAKVYYDYLNVKSELFSIGSGEEVSANSGYVDKGTVYIIVETDGECTDGSFSFSIGETAATTGIDVIEWQDDPNIGKVQPGSYKRVAITKEDETYEEMLELQDIGSKGILTVNEDGTATFELDGEKTEYTYDEFNFYLAEDTEKTNGYTYVYVGGRIVVNDGSTITQYLKDSD